MTQTFMNNTHKNPNLEKLIEKVHKALRMWYKDSAKGSPIADLQLFRQQLPKARNVRQATNQVIFKSLHDVKIKYPEHGDLLHKRYIDEVPVRQITNQMNASPSTVYKMQKEAVKYVAQELSQLEEQVFFDCKKILRERLPPPSYQNLIGVDEYLGGLQEALLSTKPPWVLCIAGLGGIGKTSLADRLVRTVFSAGPFDDLAWVSAKQNMFHFAGRIKDLAQPALSVESMVDTLLEELMGIKAGTLSPSQALAKLETLLKEVPHLIVIDNLETLLDLESLVPTLRHLANPSRFLLTSRKGLYLDPDVYHFAVPALSQQSTIELIRQEAKWRNAYHLLQASDEELMPIYEIVGGNPLALYLVIGQTHIHNLNIILEDLVKADSTKTQNLYTYIYRRAWDHLDEITRQVFLIMPLVTHDGADLDFLQATSGLLRHELTHALELLVTLSLVQMRGKLRARRYTIHNLTRSFLKEQVIRWT